MLKQAIPFMFGWLIPVPFMVAAGVRSDGLLIFDAFVALLLVGALVFSKVQDS